MNHDATQASPMLGYFVTGTDTEVGKTYVSCLLAESLVKSGLEVGVYKPVASGCEQREGTVFSEDASALWHAAGCPRSMEDVTPQRFMAPLAPNVAAREQGALVDPQRLRSGIEVWRSSQRVVVEGVGGLMSPISDQDLVVDLAVDFGLPLILVCANQLGCINATLQTLLVARHYGLQVAGVILNDVGQQRQDISTGSNWAELNRLCDVPLLCHVRHGEQELKWCPS